MAKAKKNKRKSKRLEFYESVPLSVSPPIIAPEDGARAAADAFVELSAAAQEFLTFLIALTVRSYWKIKQLTLPKLPKPRLNLGWLRPLTLQALGFAHTLPHTTSVALRRTANFAQTSARTAVTYAPPLTDDATRVMRRAAKIASGRVAKRLYLSLLLLGITAGGIFTAMTAASTVKTYASIISSPASLLSNKRTGITILDRNGQVLYQTYGASQYADVPLNQIPTSIQNATLAAEDPSFYSEPAISIRGTLRAAWVDLTHNGQAIEGGSTLTQQLVKNAILSQNKSYWRKYQEVLLAFALQQRYSKSQILDMYLNETDYGEGASGVQAAAQTYFHTSVQQLTLGQAALLAGLPLGPSRFDPNVSLSDATGRRNFVLSRMEQLGYITKAQGDAAIAQPLELASQVGTPQAIPATQPPTVIYAYDQQIQAPWFVFYVLDQLRAQYGDQMVNTGDLTVKTTLDLNKENMAEGIIQNQIANLGSHNVTNGALISLDPSTGDIISMVGSVNYNAPGFGQVNATTSLLQPGSSFKPIVYATAFEKGWTGATTVLDAPITFPGGYTPMNYDLKFHGVVTLRHALDNSLNIPAVKVLQFAGIPDSLKTAHDMGITSLNDPSQYGLSLVLGAGDVTPLDMATVYSTFDNYGTKVEPRAILAVYNRLGQNITKPATSKPTQVLDPRIAYMITNILSDAQSRLPEFPLNSPLTLDRPAAAKTGTTTDFDDNWTIGYTPQLVTAVWVGNNNHTPMQNVDGITGAAPIWHDYMEQALAGTPVENFTVPSGVTFADVCPNGGIAQGFSTGITEVFMSGQVPTTPCQSTQVAASPSPSPTPTPTPSPSPQPIEPIQPPIEPPIQPQPLAGG